MSLYEGSPCSESDSARANRSSERGAGTQGGEAFLGASRLSTSAGSRPRSASGGRLSRMPMRLKESLDPLLLSFATLVAVILAVWLMVRAIRWAKRKTRAGSVLAAAAFPFPDQPSPHEQIENANRLRKDTGSGDPE